MIETSVEGLKAAYVAGKTLKQEEISFLVAASTSDPTLVRLFERFQGETLLHWCARFGLRNETELLLQRGADPRASNGKGQKPFAVANDPDLRWRLLIAAGEKEIQRVRLDRPAIHSSRNHFVVRLNSNVELSPIVRLCAPVSGRVNLFDCPAENVHV